MLNVSQVRYSVDGTEHEYRPNCVEITVDKNRTIVVMLVLVGELDEHVDPILIGRITIPHPAQIVDAIELDGVCWAVRSPVLSISIRPYAGEGIFIDPSYGRIDLTDDLGRLYSMLRASRGALVAHCRLLKTTPERYESLRETHSAAIQSIMLAITRIEKQIVDKESSHANHP